MFFSTLSALASCLTLYTGGIQTTLNGTNFSIYDDHIHIVSDIGDEWSWSYPEYDTELKFTYNEGNQNFNNAPFCSQETILGDENDYYYQVNISESIRCNAFVDCHFYGRVQNTSTNGVNEYAPMLYYHNLAPSFTYLKDLDGQVDFVNGDVVDLFFVYDIYLLPQAIYESTLSDYNDGYTTGYQYGYNAGYEIGEDAGYSSGYQDGVADGTQTGYTSGYQNGYDTGVLEANDYSFGSLFGAVADTPVLIVRNLFNFDFFGVNLLSVILSLFTGLIIFYLLRKLL